MATVAQTAMGETIDQTTLSWYDWGHPTANQLLAVAKSVNSIGEQLFLSIPSNIILHGTPSYSFRRTRVLTTQGTVSSDLIQARSDGQVVSLGGAFSSDLNLERNFVYTFRSDVSQSFSDLGITIVSETPP